jgi:hypothetical protein
MTTNYLIPCLLFLAKYFFNMERELTQTMITKAMIGFHDCKEFVSNVALVHDLKELIANVVLIHR